MQVIQSVTYFYFLFIFLFLFVFLTVKETIMNTDFTTRFDTFEPSDTFDGSLELYRRDELEARYDYLIETAKAIEFTKDNVQVWLDAHKQEFVNLQLLLHKVPENKARCLTHIIAERYVQEYCADLLNAFICCDTDHYLYQYIDIATMAKRLADDLPRIEINGAVYFISVRDDL